MATAHSVRPAVVHRLFFFWAITLTALISFAPANESNSKNWKVGFAKVDILPKTPVRLTGYGSRDQSADSADTPLYARAIAIDAGSGPAVLVSIDNIGLPGKLTRSLAADLQRSHGIARDRVVFCSTHTHCAPTLNAELQNIFAVPLTKLETKAANQYRDQVYQAIIRCVQQALEDRSEANISYGVGTATFAVNRRVLVDGKWTGFGVQPEGPVDHRVNVLKITSPSGDLRGTVFNYAYPAQSPLIRL